MEMVIGTGSLSEAWWARTKTAAETQEAAYDSLNREFESLDLGVSESVAEYFARVHVILMKLTRHQVTTPAREIKRRVQSGLAPRFLHQVCLYVMRSDFDLSDLEAGIARAESFKSDQERRNASATRWPLPMRAAAEPGLEVEHVGEAATADAQSSATTMVEVATSKRIIHNRCIQGSSSAHSTINSRPNGSSSSGDIRSRSRGGIRSISSTIPGPAG